MAGTKGEPGRVPGAELSLGCTSRYVDGRVFVTKVLPESQAEVDEVVLAGDILDEINGCSLRYAFPGQVGGDRGLGCPPSSCPLLPSAPSSLQAGAVLQRLKGQPLTFRLLRWRWHDGSIFEPLLPYLKALKEKEPQFQLQHSPRHRGEGEPWQLQGGRWVWAMGSPQAGLRVLALGQPCAHTIPDLCSRLWGQGCPHGLEVRRGLGASSPAKSSRRDVWGPFPDAPKPFSPQAALQPAVPGPDQRWDGEAVRQRPAMG